MPHWKTKSEVTFTTVAEGLWLWSAADPASARGKTYNCYLLATKSGNVMLHPPDNAAFFKAERERIDGLGGVQHLIMTHQGDVKAGWGFAWRAWKPQMHGHAADIAILPRPARVLPFQALGDSFGGLTVLHLPGHTPGYIALVGRFGGAGYLFGGHMMVEGLTGWRSRLHERLADVGRESIGRFEGIEVDYLMPEYGWGDEVPNAHAPVPFGPEIRSRAVTQALSALKPRRKTA
jgi:glyoxylase-like metal-dependent hydrolase (beta-lactamase superfamily II)